MHAALLLLLAVSGPPEQAVVQEEITFTCSLKVCNDDPPSDLDDDFPQCSEYFLREALLESAPHDPSALALLKQRYATAKPNERRNIAHGLLRRIEDDRPFWNDLYTLAEIAVRFPSGGAEPSPDFAQWCAARNVEPEPYWGLAISSLSDIVDDPRSHALLGRALASDNSDVVVLAIIGFGMQKDLTKLPAIDRAIARFPEKTRELAIYLAEYHDDRADAVAMKYLSDDDDLAMYGEMRAITPEADPR
jgi:hypothetical protein